MRQLALVIALPAALTAQERTPACRAPHTPDSMTVAVTATLAFADTTRALPRQFEGLFLQELKQRLRLPTPFTLSTYNAPDSINGVPNQPRRAFAVVEAMIEIAVNDRRATPRLLVSSGVPAFDRALLDAIISLSADQAMPALPELARAKRTDLRLRLGTEFTPVEGTLLFRLQVPVSPLSHEVVLRSGPRSGLGFPEPLRRANVEGGVLLQYVVDQRGRVLDGSIRVIRSDHDLFTQEALGVLPKMRMSPARIGDCAVPLVVRQPFDFKLRP